MKTLFYFKLKISAGMIENLIQEISHLFLQPLEALRCFKKVGIFVPKEMLINTCVKMPNVFVSLI